MGYLSRISWRLVQSIFAVALVLSVAAAVPANASDANDHAAMLLSQHQAGLSSGRISAGCAALQRAIDADLSDQPARLAMLLALGDCHLLQRRIGRAGDLADQVLSRIAVDSDPDLAAAAHNLLGNIAAGQQAHGRALDRYAQALVLAERARDPWLSLRIRLNRAQSLMADDQPQAMLAELRRIDQAISDLSDDGQRLSAYLSVGSLSTQLLADTPNLKNVLGPVTYRMLTEAQNLAEALSDQRSRSLALGLMAQLYLHSGRLADAERLLHRAEFFAAQLDAPDLNARWQAALGRLFRERGDTIQAIAAYRRALDELQEVQPVLVFGRRGDPNYFRDTVGDIYTSLATLLLQRAETASDAETQQGLLRGIRGVMEDFKAVELKDYFQDSCVTVQSERNRALNIDSLIGPGVASLYPVVFPDRILLLLSLPEGRIFYRSVAVDEQSLQHTAREFRRQMRPDSNPRRLLRSAQRLHEWLIAPLQEPLTEAGIRTLVVVPDGVLRTIPFAALHNGEGFLVEKYALAVSPGLLLTEPTELAAEGQQVLIGGLSQGVQGFSELPYVAAEVRSIAALYDDTPLLDEGFLTARVVDALERKPYNVVSFSTHGQVGSDPRQSFVLTYDGKISLDDLERYIRYSRFRDQPLDMLVLSACDTAVGDERAALGLAGVALKAGARSAMASLWAVNDASTAELVPAFFRALQDDSNNKAQALRYAQLELLSQPQSSHPYNWAAFILIGNWQ